MFRSCGPKSREYLSIHPLNIHRRCQSIPCSLSQSSKPSLSQDCCAVCFTISVERPILVREVSMNLPFGVRRLNQSTHKQSDHRQSEGHRHISPPLRRTVERAGSERHITFIIAILFADPPFWAKDIWPMFPDVWITLHGLDVSGGIDLLVTSITMLAIDASGGWVKTRSFFRNMNSCHSQSKYRCVLSFKLLPCWLLQKFP